MTQTRFMVKAIRHKVRDGETIESLARDHNLSWQELAKFNWGTDKPDRINRFLRSKVGCRKKTADGKNYVFSNEDDPGIIFIPQDFDGMDLSTNTMHEIKFHLPTYKTFIPAKCAVKFWPGSAWKGEYGFDWLREGKSDVPEDKDYKDLVGTYPVNGDPDYNVNASLLKLPLDYSVLQDAYEPFQLPWKQESEYKNFQSWLTLFPENEKKSDSAKSIEANIVLNIEVEEEEPEELFLRFRSIGTEEEDVSKPDELFQLSTKSVSPKSVGTNQMNLNIKCLKPFDQTQILEVVMRTNEENGDLRELIVGQLNILCNAEENRKVANVVLIKVRTKYNGNPVEPAISSEGPFLKKFIYQSLINLNLVENEELDLTKDDTFKNKYSNKLGLKYYFNGKPHSDLMSLFGKSIEEQNKKSAAKKNYNGWYHVFYFEEEYRFSRQGKNYLLLGQADGIPSKCVVVYKNKDTSTGTHELLHAIGLYHSFSNRSPFVFEQFKTENIMDYSNSGVTGNIQNKYSTWKWQWEKLNSSLPLLNKKTV